MNGRLTARNVRIAITGIALIAFTLAGCASTPEPEEATAPGPDSEFSQGDVPAEPSEAKGTQRLNLQAVYFGTDRSEISPDARSTLRDNAGKITGGSNTGVITIEGHCDDRGAEEYNLALGERRANSVRKYMVNLGVRSDRLRTVSYGEARPAVQGNSESAWKWNRRVDFKTH